MSNLLWFSDYMRTITAKNLSVLLGISLSCANRYMLDIKKEYDAKRVCLGHLMDYFNLPYETAVKYAKILEKTKK